MSIKEVYKAEPILTVREVASEAYNKGTCGLKNQENLKIQIRKGMKAITKMTEEPIISYNISCFRIPDDGYKYLEKTILITSCAAKKINILIPYMFH